jgi:hypothetical protein
VTSFTLCYRSIPTNDEIAAVDAAVHSAAGTIEWQISKSFGRAYALVEAERGPEAVRAAAAGARVTEQAIIALAVFPSVAQALPLLCEALEGAGKPAGVLSAQAVEGAAIVEWDPALTQSAVVLDLIDAELARYRSGRVNELLSPLPLEAWTRLAADGLRAPEIAPDRVLEHLIEAHHVTG